MIKEEFIQAKILQQQADLKAFTTVFKFLNQKVEETEEAGQQDKLRAYKEVEQLFKNRMNKVSAEFDKMMTQYEFQKSRKRKSWKETWRWQVLV